MESWDAFGLWSQTAQISVLAHPGSGTSWLGVFGQVPSISQSSFPIRWRWIVSHLTGGKIQLDVIPDVQCLAVPHTQ